MNKNIKICFLAGVFVAVIIFASLPVQSLRIPTEKNINDQESSFGGTLIVMVMFRYEDNDLLLPVRGSSVTLTGNGISETKLTDTLMGRVYFRGLSYGTYTATASKRGFKTNSYTGTFSHSDQWKITLEHTDISKDRQPTLLLRLLSLLRVLPLQFLNLLQTN